MSVRIQRPRFLLRSRLSTVNRDRLPIASFDHRQSPTPSASPALLTLPHNPRPNEISDRRRRNPAKNIRNVVIPPINRRKAHAQHQRQQRPEQPSPMPPRSPQRRKRSRNMLRRKRRPAHAPIVLDETNQRRKRPATQFPVPHSRHRKPRALDRKQSSRSCSRSNTPPSSTSSPTSTPANLSGSTRIPQRISRYVK